MRFQSLRILGIIAAFLFILAAIAYQQSFAEVIFIINEQSQTVYVRAGTVGQAVQAAHILINPGDTISPSLETPLASSPQITIQKANHIAIEVDGEVIRAYSHATDPLRILEDAGITLGTADEVIVDGSPLWSYLASGNPPRTMRVLRGVTLTLDDDGITGEVTTTAKTAAAAVRATGLTLYLADRITPDLSASLNTETNAATRLEIIRSMPVTLKVDGREIKTRVSAATVGEALGVLGITLGGGDYTLPEESAPLNRDMEITVVRVTEEMILTESTLPFELYYEPDPDLPLDEQRIIQPGEEGLRQDRIRVRYEDGRETSRTLLEEVTLRPPVNEGIAYGTKIVLHPLSASTGQLAYWRVIPMQAASYTPAEPDEDAITGFAIANSTIIPPGSRLYVENYGLAVVIAPDNSLPQLEIKLWYPGLEQPLPGESVNVYLLPPAPENILYQLPGRSSDGTQP